MTEALVMLGIPPFFRGFGPQMAAEDLLASQPEALAGFHDVLRHALRSDSPSTAWTTTHR